MAKLSRKLPISSMPGESKFRSNKYDRYNFVAKSPSDDKKRSRNSYKCIEENPSEEPGGLPMIKATEGPIIVTFGGIQLIAGLLMVAFGILSMLHDAALSGIGAGLWGGAMGAANGLVGIVAGFKGCYQKTDRISPLAVTVYLAICLVAIGVGNLALVLTATGLLRDFQRPIYFLPLRPEEELAGKSSISTNEMEDLQPDWSRILTNLGLLLITSVECLITIAATFRCYWYVCSCRNRCKNLRTGRLYGDESTSPDVATISYCSTTSSSKQKLVRQWLGQQQSVAYSPATTPVPFYPMHPPPPSPHHHPPHHPSPHHHPPHHPPINCCLPPPYYTIERRPRYPSASYVKYYEDYNNCMITPYYIAGGAKERYTYWPKVPAVHRPYSQECEIRELAERKIKTDRRTTKEKHRKISDISVPEEDVDKTYTGLDREIAEEFISVAMEPKRNAN